MSQKGFTPIFVALFVVIILALGGGVLYYSQRKAVLPTVTPPVPAACTQEAKQCPDGSYVGRVLPNCEFAACPPQAATSSVAAPVQKISHTQCAEGENFIVVPTSTAFEAYGNEAEQFCLKLMAGQVLPSPDGKWTAVMESGRKPNGAPIYYHFVYKDFKDKSIGVSDLNNNVFIVFTNLATGEEKKVSVISVATQSAIASIAPTILSEAGFNMYSSLVKWSSDGRELWGGVYFYWKGMDMLAAPPALSFFEIDTRNWQVASFPDEGNAVNVKDSDTLNADRRLVLYGEEKSTSTLSLNFYNFVSGTTTTLASWSSNLCAHLKRECNGPGPCGCEHSWDLQTQKLQAQWVDSSTVSWIDPTTGKVVTKSGL